MCGRFAQFHSRDEFLAALASDTPVSTTGDWRARYNVAPGTPVPLFHHHHDQLQLAPVDWGYAPAWWRAQGKPALINARVETAASSRIAGKAADHRQPVVWPARHAAAGLAPGGVPIRRARGRETPSRTAVLPAYFGICANQPICSPRAVLR
nr:hypothetical protein F28p_00037 [Serratia proteamaculans]